MDENFLGNIRAQQWYNKDSPRNLSGYLNDKTNRLIGWATMRQLRIKPNLCRTNQHLTNHCNVDYSKHNEEKRSFTRGWINETDMSGSNSSIDQSFVYRSDKKLIGNVINGKHGRYSGGGYVYEYRGRLDDLRRNLTKLHQLEWIDDRTRAVSIEMTLYNPNVQLFTSIILLAEFLSTGGIETMSRFQPISFQCLFLLI